MRIVAKGRVSSNSRGSFGGAKISPHAGEVTPIVRSCQVGKVSILCRLCTSFEQVPQAYASLSLCSQVQGAGCPRLLISPNQSRQRMPHPFGYAQGRLFAHFAKGGSGHVGTPYLSG